MLEFLRNKLNLGSVHEIMNTPGLLQGSLSETIWLHVNLAEQVRSMAIFLCDLQSVTLKPTYSATKTS